MDSIYDSKQTIAELVARGQHRSLVGGLWDEIGNLQFEYMKSAGLRPHNHMLDIGCGSLRGGIRFIAYLEPGCYWGLDKNGALLNAGRSIELKAAGLTDRLPAENLIESDSFEFERFGRRFDFALAQSVFTHLSLPRIRLCFQNLSKVMLPRGRFYATIFEVPNGHPLELPGTFPMGTETYADKDPFHHSRDDIERAISGLSWRLIDIHDWGHPRGQRMAIFERIS